MSNYKDAIWRLVPAIPLAFLLLYFFSVVGQSEQFFVGLQVIAASGLIFLGLARVASSDDPGELKGRAEAFFASETPRALTILSRCDLLMVNKAFKDMFHLRDIEVDVSPTLFRRAIVRARHRQDYDCLCMRLNKVEAVEERWCRLSQLFMALREAKALSPWGKPAKTLDFRVVGYSNGRVKYQAIELVIRLLVPVHRGKRRGDWIAEVLVPRLLESEFEVEGEVVPAEQGGGEVIKLELRGNVHGKPLPSGVFRRSIHSSDDEAKSYFHFRDKVLLPTLRKLDHDGEDAARALLQKAWVEETRYTLGTIIQEILQSPDDRSLRQAIQQRIDHLPNALILSHGPFIAELEAEVEQLVA